MLWAKLFNLRYRVLLTELAHIVAIPVTAVWPDPAGQNIRKMLILWLYQEMKLAGGSISYLAPKLASLPASTVAGPTAGAPFELPYTLAIPDRGPERWRLHLDLIDATVALIGQIPGSAADPLLQEILTRDGKTPMLGRRKQIADLMASPL